MTTLPNAIPPFAGDPTGAAGVFAPALATEDAGVTAQSNCTDRLNGLLRGEIAAVETYRQVIEKAAAAGHTVAARVLTQMLQQHEDGVISLQDRILAQNGVPTESSGLWGVWATTVAGAMTLVGGDVGGIHALIDGEEHGLADYQSAIPELDPTSAQVIQNRLIPAQQAHIQKLKDLASDDLK